jgi:MerR HTH family regulatory protein
MSADVKAVLGINEGTLQNWLARGREIKLKKQKPGSGTPRHFEAHEVIRIAVIKKLTDVGFPLKPAFEFAGAIAGLFEQYGAGIQDQVQSGFTHSLLIASKHVFRETNVVSIPGCSVIDSKSSDFSAAWHLSPPVNAAASHSALNQLQKFGDTAIVINIGALAVTTLRALRAAFSIRTAVRLGPS